LGPHFSANSLIAGPNSIKQLCNQGNEFIIFVPHEARILVGLELLHCFANGTWLVLEPWLSLALGEGVGDCPVCPSKWISMSVRWRVLRNL
jgi:hypothetical protein